MSLIDVDVSPGVRIYRASTRRAVRVVSQEVASIRYRVALDCGHEIEVCLWEGRDPLQPHFCPQCRDALAKQQEGK